MIVLDTCTVKVLEQDSVSLNSVIVKFLDAHCGDHNEH